VAELDCLSGVIEKKKQQLKELDALAQSIFYEMFGNPIENEKGWEVKSLGDICKFSQGIQIDVSLQSKENQEGWRKFLRIVDYTTSNTDIRYVKVSNEKYFVKLDDVVVVRYGASAGFVGTNKEGILANNLFKLNHERKIINHKFLFYLLSTDYYNRFVKDMAFGAAMPALSFASFSTFKIFLPPLSLQQEFASKIELIEKQKELIKKSIKETETLFNSRMDYYFN
jgi:type I restriction enzyme S subunit